MLTFGRPTKQQLDQFDPKSVANGQNIFYGTFSRSDTDPDPEDKMYTININNFDNLDSPVSTSDVVNLYFLGVSFTVEATSHGISLLALKYGDGNFIDAGSLIASLDVPNEDTWAKNYSIGNFLASGQKFQDNGYSINQYGTDSGISIWNDWGGGGGTDLVMAIKGELLLYTNY